MKESCKRAEYCLHRQQYDRVFYDVVNIIIIMTQDPYSVYAGAIIQLNNNSLIVNVYRFNIHVYKV